MVMSTSLPHLNSVTMCIVHLFSASHQYHFVVRTTRSLSHKQAYNNMLHDETLTRSNQNATSTEMPLYIEDHTPVCSDPIPTNQANSSESQQATDLLEMPRRKYRKTLKYWEEEKTSPDAHEAASSRKASDASHGESPATLPGPMQGLPTQALKEKVSYLEALVGPSAGLVGNDSQIPLTISKEAPAELYEIVWTGDSDTHLYVKRDEMLSITKMHNYGRSFPAYKLLDPAESNLCGSVLGYKVLGRVPDANAAVVLSESQAQSGLELLTIEETDNIETVEAEQLDLATEPTPAATAEENSTQKILVPEILPGSPDTAPTIPPETEAEDLDKTLSEHVEALPDYLKSVIYLRNVPVESTYQDIFELIWTGAVASLWLNRVTLDKQHFEATVTFMTNQGALNFYKDCQQPMHWNNGEKMIAEFAQEDWKAEGRPSRVLWIDGPGNFMDTEGWKDWAKATQVLAGLDHWQYKPHNDVMRSMVEVAYNTVDLASIALHKIRQAGTCRTLKVTFGRDRCDPKWRWQRPPMEL